MTDARQALHLWLDRLRLRSSLVPAECDAVLSLPGEVVTVSGSRDFVRLGERVDRACLIVSGMAGRFGQTRNGDRQITALHLPGDMADLHSFVLPTAATALQALGQTTIYRVPHGSIDRISKAYPALGEAFWRDCTVDAAVLAQWNLVNSRLPARAKIAHILCELCCRILNGICADGSEIPFFLTQAQLGDLTGLTSVHVNRMLRDAREAGAADVKERVLRVISWQQLVRIAEFDPRYLALEQQPTEAHDRTRA